MNRSALWDGGRESPDAGHPRAGSTKAAIAPPAGEAAPTVRRSAAGRLVARLGWRAYAVPLLIVATVILAINITQSPKSTASAGDPEAASVAAEPPSAGAATPAVTTKAANAASAANPAESPATAAPTSDPGSAQPQASAESAETLAPNLQVGALPLGEPFTGVGDRSYRILPGGGQQFGTSNRVKTYTIEIENGVVLPGGDEEFAGVVDSTLSDPRSWTSITDAALQRIDATGGEPDFRVTLVSQETAHEICGYSVPLESSCYSRDVGRVVINDARWVRGALSYAGDLTSYRQYAINHEVGHALGYGHQACPTDGGLAPTMMQQSWSVSNDGLAGINGSVTADGKVCKPNPWPDPQGAEGQATQTTG